MNNHRDRLARLIAAGIALGGTPFAAFFAAWPFEIGFPWGIANFLLFSPGWLAYFALIWAAFGKRIPGDPFATWLPCILVNGSWLMVLFSDTDFSGSNKAFVSYYVRAYVVAAVAGAVVGLMLELNHSRRSGV